MEGGIADPELSSIADAIVTIQSKQQPSESKKKIQLSVADFFTRPKKSAVVTQISISSRYFRHDASPEPEIHEKKRNSDLSELVEDNEPKKTKIHDTAGNSVLEAI